MKMKTLWALAIAATLCSCHSGNQSTNENQLLFVTEADDYEEDDVQIISSPDGRLRYTAWDRESDISDEPNIVLYGKRVGDEYHFYNPPTFTYVVTTGDIPEVRTYHSETPGQLGKLYDTYTDN